MRKSMLLIVTLVFMSIGAAYATEWVTISGTVLYDEKPLNVMVLANGQYMFTDPSDGRYEMDVPLAENGEITLFSFCDGFAPFKEILGSNEAGTFDIRMSVAPSESMILTLTHEAQPLENGWVEISGIATYDGKPLNIMVLANGQHMFTDPDDGKYKLEVPLNDSGKIILYGFCDGFQPFKVILDESGNEVGDSPSDVGYTGLTNRAMIDEYNAEDIAVGAYQVNRTTAPLGSVGGNQTRNNISSRTLKVSKHLNDSLHQTYFMYSEFTGTVHTVEGNCGGSASFIYNSDQIENLSGSGTFNNYCNDGVTMSGDVDTSWKLKGMSSSMFFHFDKVTVTWENNSWTLFNNDVSIILDYNSPFVMTMTMTGLAQDNGSGKVYKYENYTFTCTITTDVNSENYVEVRINGTYYYPDYGYVNISSNSAFHTNNGDSYPSDGTMIVTGDTGVAGSSTKARLTFSSKKTYQVDADTNGDGTYDWNSGVLYWDDL